MLLICSQLLLPQQQPDALAAPAAVKVLDHAVNLQDDISRESLLSTSLAHPLVVGPALRP